jgi:hypothetical protein
LDKFVAQPGPQLEEVVEEESKEEGKKKKICRYNESIGLSY